MKNTNSSSSSKDLGNNRTKSNTKKKQISPARNWEFVVNNYTEEDIKNLEKLDSSIVPVFVAQTEVGEKGTPHIQATFSFAKGKKGRPSSVIKAALGHGRFSARKVKKIENIRNYCIKQDRGDDKRGWRVCRGWKPHRRLVKMTYELLRPYQKLIADKFVDYADPLFSRDIWWFWEPEGNVGKTIMSMYFTDQRGALVVGGNAGDIFCGVARECEAKREPEVVIFDIPRSSRGYVSYKAIEKVKDGIFYSTKYESGMCRFNRPHVICFANELPDEERLSSDRWNIVRYGECFT